MSNDNPSHEVSNTADNVALNAVSDIVAELQPGSMVQRFVVIVETICEHGKKNLSGYFAPDQTTWETMGLLDYAISFERAGFRFPPPEDEE